MKPTMALVCGLLLLGGGEARAREVPYGNDALPSAEVAAFVKRDRRLRYRDARIGHDARLCAVYEGRAPNGRVRRHPLRDARGRPICLRRR